MIERGNYISFRKDFQPGDLFVENGNTSRFIVIVHTTADFAYYGTMYVDPKHGRGMFFSRLKHGSLNSVVWTKVQ